MGTFQLKIGFRMIKINFSPPIAVMVTLTGRFRVIFFIQVRLMDIFMTINASVTNLPETPFVTLFMTGKTGRCQVSTR